MTKKTFLFSSPASLHRTVYGTDDIHTVKFSGHASDYTARIGYDNGRIVEIVSKADLAAHSAALAKDQQRSQLIYDYETKTAFFKASNYKEFIEKKISEVETQIRSTQKKLLEKNQQLESYNPVDRLFRWNKKADKKALETKLTEFEAAKADFEQRLPSAIRDEAHHSNTPYAGLEITTNFSAQDERDYRAFHAQREQAREAQLTAKLTELGLVEKVDVPAAPEGLMLADIETIIVEGTHGTGAQIVNLTDLRAGFEKLWQESGKSMHVSNLQTSLADYAQPMPQQHADAMLRSANLIDATPSRAVGFGNRYNFVEPDNFVQPKAPATKGHHVGSRYNFVEPDNFVQPKAPATKGHHEGSITADFVTVQAGQTFYALDGNDHIQTTNYLRAGAAQSGPVKTVLCGGAGVDTVTFDLRNLQIRRVGNDIEIKTVSVSEGYKPNNKHWEDLIADKEERDVIWTLKGFEEIELKTTSPHNYQTPSAFIDPAKVKNTEWQALNDLTRPKWIDDSNVVYSSARKGGAPHLDTLLYNVSRQSSLEEKGRTDWGFEHQGRRDFADAATSAYLKSVASAKPGIGDQSHWSFGVYDDSNGIFNGTHFYDNMLITRGKRVTTQGGDDDIWCNDIPRGASQSKLLETRIDGGSGTDTFHLFYSNNDTTLLTYDQRRGESVLTVKHHCTRHDAENGGSQWFLGDKKGTCPEADHEYTSVFKLKNVEKLAIHGYDEKPTVIFLNQDHASYEIDDSALMHLKHFVPEAA